jgi:transcriptional regulator with PAS, ATPase and Fis domain
MESSRKLAAVLERPELQRNLQEVILNPFEDGLLSANEAGTMEVGSRAMGRLLNRKVDQLIGMSIREVLGDIQYRASLPGDSRIDTGSSMIYEYDNRQIVVQKIPVLKEKQAQTIYTFCEVARIQSLEKDVRVRLASKGYLTKYSFEDIWTDSILIEELKAKARNFAATEKNILITGESGTGKELFAHASTATRPGAMARLLP